MGKVGRVPPGSPQYHKTVTSNVRYEPYPKSKPRTKKTNASEPSEANKENIDANPKPKARAPKPKKTPDAQLKYSDWRNIELDETMGEVPCYDNAATVRRKLKKLLADKTIIPCGDGKKKWS
ncbi:MAG: hypothetical protein LQ350_004707 [Teloschistes chrysophthalmus]|nr:MAG: hypothetical protein LQ350_004707 [Niorma chrysophthalma]